MAGEETLCEILYLKKLDQDIFADLKKRVENYYVLKKSEYPSMVTKVQIQMLNYQHNYNSNRNSYSSGVINHLMLRNAVKLGTTRVTEKRRSRDPVETWIILHATTV